MIVELAALACGVVVSRTPGWIAMHIVCPHCRNPIEVVAEQPTQTAQCPLCGSTLTLVDPDRTASYRETGQWLAGRFEMIRLLGSGAFGDVWEAQDFQLNRRVALKIPRKESLTASDVDRILREARIAEWPFGPVRTPAFDATPVPVFGLYSGVAEMTDSIWTQYPGAPPLPPAIRELNRHSRMVRGGPTYRQAVDVEKRPGGLGFRWARGPTPGLMDGRKN